MLVRGKSVPCENISITFIQTKNSAGQIGELVRNTLPAAFASALSLALATQLTKIPCTEKQLFELIKQRETITEKQPQPADDSQNEEEQADSKEQEHEEKE